MTIDDMKQGVSRIRNHVIARVFRELRLIEQWGSGVRRMFREAESQGLPEPQIEEIGMRLRFTVTLAKPLPVTVEQETPERMLKEIISLAREYGLSTYDASYLDLAMRLDLPIATQDALLVKAAQKCKVPAYEPTRVR